VSLAQTQPKASSLKNDPQAVQLLASAFQAIGGGQRAALADVRIEGTLRSPAAPDQIIGTFVAKVRGEDWALETTIGNRTNKFRVLNGSGTLDNGGSIKLFQPSITSGTRLDLFPLFHRWTEFNQPGSLAWGVGPTTLDGVACTQIHVHSALTNLHPAESEQHGEIDVLVDFTSGLIAAIRYKAMLGMPNPHLIGIENRFAQYQRLGGLLMPTRITRYLAGQPRTVFQVTAVQINNGFTDQDFRNHGGNGQ